MEKFTFKFWLIKTMVRSDLSFENAEDIDGEVVASLIQEIIQNEISVLNSFNSNREGIWKLPERWKEFYMYSRVDPDYLYAIDSEYSDGKVLDSKKVFDVKLIFDSDGTIEIEAENFIEAKRKLPEQVRDDIWDAVDNQNDSLIQAIFYSGTVTHFEFEPQTENGEDYNYDEEED